ncbi:tandem-95 repeat protein, partial [filamentous cyanobacterium LEGE 07170]|nr:tandem-95 repeat protein [filamentous cyanobacterium LEGE 07170]
MSYRSILFIDSDIENFQRLLREVEPSAKVVVLDSQNDGVRQITKVLSEWPGCKTVYIVAHGTPGSLNLGSTQLSLDTLERYSWDLQSWFPAASHNTELPALFLYGCQVAAGDAGAEFVETLHRLTGAQIAASTTLIGHASQGGNWQLDYTVGQAQAKLPIAASALAAYPGILAAPVIEDSVEAARAVDEEGTLAITGISVSDADAGDTQTVTLNVTEGVLNLDPTTIGSLTGVSGDGSGSVTFSGSQADVNAALDKLTYIPADDYSGNDTLAITVNDGSESASLDVAIAVTPVNDAPVLTPSGISVAEGGNSAFDITNIDITDVDNDAVQIIVKIASLPGKGTLTFNGNPLVVGSTFSYDQLANLRYVHDGTQTTAPGGTSDSFEITVDDGADGLIAATAIPVTITPVNQLPTASGTNNVFEGALDQPVSIAISDPDQDVNTPYTIEITELPEDGVLKLGGVAVTPGQTFSSEDLATLTYSHDGNDEGFGNPPPDSFKIKITDDGGGTGIPESSDAITIDLNIKPNNDDPTLEVNNGTSLNTADGLTKVITATDLAVSDPDSPTAQLTYTLTEAPDPTIGGLEVFNGTDWVRIGAGVSFTQDDLDNGRVRYAFHKDSTGNENFADSFKFQVRDGEIREYPTEREGGIWNADGSALETLTFDIAITVPPDETGGDGGTKNPDVTSNTPPVTEINAGIANLAEGDTTPITDALLRTTDTDNSASEIVYRITSLPTSGAIELTIGAETVALGLFGSFTQDDIDNGRVAFNHAGNENFTDAFRFTVSDGKTVIAEQTFGIDVTPVNDAPTVTTSGSPFLPEEGTVIIDNSYLSVGDVDGSGDKSGQGFATINTLTFQIVDNNGVVGPTHGTLQVERNGVWVDVDENTVLTKAELDGNKLRYVHDGSENFTDEFFVQATDDSGQTDSNTSNIQKVDITIAPLNDVPEFNTSAPLEVVEGDSGIIKGTNGTAGDEPRLIYTDPDNTEVQRQYRVTDATDFGTLFLNGKALSVGSVFTQEDLDNDRISYTHDGSENYEDEFLFTVSDGGGTGVDGNYQIDITPVNDAPTLEVPDAQDFDTAAPLVFSNGTNNAINIDDVDLASIETGETDIIKVTLDLQEPGGATYGGSTLTLGSTNGITVDPTDDGSNGKITIEGTLADVQNALDGLQVQVPNDEDRTLSLEVTVDDLLNGEPGSPPTGETVTKSIAIRASNVNDDPAITSPATVSVNEDQPLTFTGGDAISISDADTFNSNNNTVTVSVTEGTLSLSDTSLITGGFNDSSSITLTGSIEDINDALEDLSYEGDRHFNGSDTLTIVANDQGNFGSGGGSNIIQTVDITVVPVNDRPRLTAPNGIQTIDDGTALVFSDANGNAITINDNADLQNNGNDDFTVTVTVPSGTLSASGANVSGNNSDTLTITGTRDEINTALDGLSYSPADFNGDETIDLQVTVNDNANGGTAIGGIGDAREATETVTINVSSNNEAPVLTAPPSITLPEDNQVIFENGNAISIDDPDDFGGELQVTLEVEYGTLTLGSTTNLTFVEGDGTDDAKITIRGTETDLNAALEGLSYEGDADFNGPDDALSLVIDDLGNTGSGGNNVVNQSIDITVTPVNDAPTRTSPTTTLEAIAEDDTNPSGSTVTALFNGNFQDLKDNQTAVNGSAADDLAGVAITNNAATADQGVWQWFDGTDWNDIGNPSVGSALVLAAGTQVRFLPATNFNGTPGDLTVRLIDDSDGAVTSGSTVDVSTSGGTTQYSNNGNAVTLSTEVTPVNDAPIATGTATLPAVDEDTPNPPGEQVSNLFGTTFSDATDDVTDGSSANDLAGIAIIGNPTTAAEGTWEYFDGSTWQSVGNPSPGNALLVSSDDSLRFVPTADYNGPAPTLSVHLIDDSNGTVTTGGTIDLSNPNATGGTTPYSADPVPLESTVNPVNDDPTLGNLGGSVLFTEGEDPVVLDSDAIANDLELDGFGDWNGATLTLGRQGGADGQDVFGNSGTLDALSEGTPLVVDNTTVGTITTNSNGTLVLTFNGDATSALVDRVLQQITYSNASDDPPGSVEITYTLSDGNTGAQGSGGALTDTGSVTVNITPTSDKPVVTGGATLLYTENEAPQVVDNTLVLTDPDDTELISATATISNGFTTGDILDAVTAGTNITASYDPDTGVLTLTGPDTLANYQQVMRSVTYESTSETPTATTRTVTWQVTDANSDNAGTESSTPITSTIQVNPLPDPVNDDFTTNEDEVLNGIVKDTDEGDGPGTYAVETPTSNGTLNFNPDGTFTYTPNDDFNGTDTFTYKVTDANGDEATAIGTITVNPVVDIDDDDATTDEDVPVKISVLDNDDFEDPDAEITDKTDGDNGTVTINPDGTVTYTPDPGFSGIDTFEYTVTSGGVTETATVEVTVNALPDPVDDTFTTNEDEALNGTVKDTDEGDGPGTYAVETPTSNGTLNFNPDGTFTYTPNDDFNGTDTFTYKVTDANGDEATATATITVNPVIDIDDDDATTNEDVPVQISVLDNDDFEDPNAEITGKTDGDNGTVTINPDGTVTYTPDPDFNGTDTFTYTVTSGGVEETATVEVVVNPVVDIDDDDATTNEDVPVQISVLDNDDFEDPNAEITGKTDGDNGTVTINPDGTVTYTPDPDFNGTDTFTYTVTSGGVEETATVEVVVNPVVDIDDDDATTNEDVPVKILVLDNDDFEDPNAEITGVTDGTN